jgi:hypothetical protein
VGEIKGVVRDGRLAACSRDPLGGFNRVDLHCDKGLARPSLSGTRDCRSGERANGERHAEATI